VKHVRRDERVRQIDRRDQREDRDGRPQTEGELDRHRRILRAAGTASKGRRSLAPWVEPSYFPNVSDLNLSVVKLIVFSTLLAILFAVGLGFVVVGFPGGGSSRVASQPAAQPLGPLPRPLPPRSPQSR